MLLFLPATEMPDWPQGAVVLDPKRDFLCQVEADFRAGRKIEPRVGVQSMERLFERRIEREIPSSNLLVDDGPNFTAPGVFGELAPLITDLRRQAHPDWPVPFRRNSHSGPNIDSDPF